MQEERISKHVCQTPEQGKYVIYWMQQAQRASHNHALNYAIDLANARQIPLLVVFVISSNVLDANLRHYQFMLEGLMQTAQSLLKAGMEFRVLAGDPADLIAPIAADAACVISDTGYLHWQRDWRNDLQTTHPELPFCAVESDVIVPVGTVSPKEEYAAATIRSKILKQLPDFLEPAPLPPYTVKTQIPLNSNPHIPILNIQDGMAFPDLLDFAQHYIQMDTSVQPVKTFTGGYTEALQRLDTFLEQHLHLYATQRNDPSLLIQSDLSPYLHFGQISSLEIALRVLDFAGIPAYAVADLIRDKANLTPLQAGVASFLEELIVRRELSCNFCHYNDDYDDYACIPLWARKTLNDHRLDARPHLYSSEQLETAQTADPYWNAAQTEMVVTGKMHNYMRMYWGKKVIEWTPDPETAFHLLLQMNNKYSLDGRDPNSYAGIAWCFGKHDRPWQERAVFGKVRYMNARGLLRKFQMQAYLDRIDFIQDTYTVEQT